MPVEILRLARAARVVTVLTGAGMSAESGIATFRDAQTGLWARYDPLQLATPEAFARNPDLVFGWYLWRFGLLRRAEPNEGHLALARWGEQTLVRIATQNVDDLHERAGSEVLTHLHGSLAAFRCARCSRPYAGELPVPDEEGPVPPPTCGACGGLIRPGVVWFGEALPEGAMDRATEACLQSDLVLVVGTSGLVYPAAALPEMAWARGIPVVEINPSPTDLVATYQWPATAATALPALIDALG